MPARGRAGLPARPSNAQRPRRLRGANLSKYSERRLADRQLVELGVDAAELVGPALVAALDLDLAQRQRRRRHPNRAEPAAPRLGGAQQVEVDVDLEHVLHAADVGVAELLVRVEERAAPLGARAGVDDLVAVHFAAAALELVLRPKRELARPGRRLLAHAHIRIVGAMTRAPQDLTSRPFGG